MAAKEEPDMQGVLQLSDILPYDARQTAFLEPKTVQKPWGHEEWLVLTDTYAMKLLYVDAGHRLSVQYHKEKMETLKLLSGTCQVTLGAEGDVESEGHEFLYRAEDSMALHINPRTVHTFRAITPIVFVEVSTPHLEDVVRLEDRYGRAGK